jgi:hypothetical protein
MEKDEVAQLEEKGFDETQFYSFKFPSDVELAEHWRKLAEQDRTEEWEMSMKLWHWTEEHVAYRKRAPDVKAAFLKELLDGKWNSFQLDRPYLTRELEMKMG